MDGTERFLFENENGAKRHIFYVNEDLKRIKEERPLCNMSDVAKPEYQSGLVMSVNKIFSDLNSFTQQEREKVCPSCIGVLLGSEPLNTPFMGIL